MKAGTDARLGALREKKNSLKDIKIQQMKLQAALHVAFGRNAVTKCVAHWKKNNYNWTILCIFMSARVFLCLL